MSEYIKKDDIGLTDFEIASYAPDYRAVLKAILTKIQNAPTIEVVRCKDCKHFNWWVSQGKETFDCFRFLDAPPITPDFYCAWGEKREDE